MASSNDAWVAEALRAEVARRGAGEPPLLVVVGPTASGKTELALRLAEALDAEIVNVDSVQIYRRFDIGSGKPTRSELERAPHHLVDCFDPLEPIEASRFRELADDAIRSIHSRKKRVILSGGTFLWHRAVLFGLADAPPADATIRKRHRAIAGSEGRTALHHRLREVDPESAARLHPNDLVRVSRALEVYELSGRKMSDVQREHGFKNERYPHLLVGLRHDDETLTRRIEARARTWLETGWLEEVEGLLRDGYAEARALDSVGYREVRAYLAGKLPKEELLPAIVRSTRTFVRRQKTWLGHSDVLWLDAAESAR